MIIFKGIDIGNKLVHGTKIVIVFSKLWIKKKNSFEFETNHSQPVIGVSNQTKKKSIIFYAFFSVWFALCREQRINDCFMHRCNSYTGFNLSFLW